jgi:hypothetical protein
VSWDALISVAAMLTGPLAAEQGAAGAYVTGGCHAYNAHEATAAWKRIYAVQCNVMPGRGLVWRDAIPTPTGAAAVK